MFKKFYIQYYNKIFNKKYNKLLLGRWNITYKKVDIDRKVYLANIDNCGPCGNILKT